MFRSKKQNQEIALLKHQLAEEQIVNQQLKQALDSQASQHQELSADHDKLQRTIAALDKSMAIIEFDTSGLILTANQNFLKTVGYSLNEVQGQHHRIFCDDSFYHENPRDCRDD